MKNKECLKTIKRLCGYMENDLSLECCEEIEKHLRECESCRGEYSKMENALTLCRKSREALSEEEKMIIKENIFKLIEKE